MAGRTLSTMASAALAAVAYLAWTDPQARSDLDGLLGRVRIAAAGVLGSAMPRDAAPVVVAESEAPGLAPRFASAATYEPPADGPFGSHTLAVDGQARRWWSLTGEGGGANRPALVLLHGSGRDGRAMLDMFQGLSGDDAPVLIAPDSLDSSTWSGASDGPAFLEAVLADAQRALGFDPSRVLLFGHSAGGGFALQLANRGQGPWRAVAVHAGAIDPALVRFPEGDAVPLRLYAGDEDATVPPNMVRASALALAEAGHPAEVVTIPGHDHWFYAIGPRIARDAWDFLSRP